MHDWVEVRIHTELSLKAIHLLDNVIGTAGHDIDPCGHYTLFLFFYIVVSRVIIKRTRRLYCVLHSR